MTWTHAFDEHVATLSLDQMVFLDESGATIAMTRSHARAPRGLRVHDKVPRNRGTVLTMLGALSLSGLIAMGTIDAGTSTDVFAAYVEQVLAPELKQGQVVIMDNLAAHRSPRIKTLIEAVGASVLFLPPYSPEKNPIELFWSWLKANLRRLKPRTREGIETAIVQCMDALPAKHIRSWFSACGYAR